MKKDVEDMKINDPSRRNNVGAVCQDTFLLYIVKKYRVYVEIAKQFVKNAFTAADLDGNGFCSLGEF